LFRGGILTLNHSSTNSVDNDTLRLATITAVKESQTYSPTINWYTLMPKARFPHYFATLIVIASCASAYAQSVVDPSPTYPTCTYGNRIKGTQKKFPCRVITSGKGGEVLFIDEYSGRLTNSKTVARHDERKGWYAPAVRKNECLLRGQGSEYICAGKPWAGI
jgi:hypothetical protein